MLLKDMLEKLNCKKWSRDHINEIPKFTLYQRSRKQNLIVNIVKNMVKFNHIMLVLYLSRIT